MLRLDQRHALKAFRASVGDVEGHKSDCILAWEGAQLGKAGSVRIKAREITLQMTKAS